MFGGGRMGKHGAVAGGMVAEGYASAGRDFQADGIVADGEAAIQADAKSFADAPDVRPPMRPEWGQARSSRKSRKSLILWSLIDSGAGDGNRTHVASLEGWSSTTELHPHASSSILATALALSIHDRVPLPAG